MRIDPVTADQIRAILLASRARGVDPVEILDRADLLDHPSKRLEWSAVLLEEIVAQLRTGPMGMALNARVTAHLVPTPMDMKNELLRLLEEGARKWRSEANASKAPKGPAT